MVRGRQTRKYVGQLYKGIFNYTYDKKETVRNNPLPHVNIYPKEYLKYTYRYSILLRKEIHMNKKLTLNIEEELIQFAHNYAKRSKQSISSIVETYLGALKNTKENQEELNSRTKELYGIFENDQLPDKEELRKQFHEKNTRRS